MARIDHLKLWAAALILISLGCGSKKGNSPAASNGGSSMLQTKLELVAAKGKVPSRMLMAVAWMESGLNTKRATVIPSVVSTEGSSEASPQLGFQVGESAFGLDRKTLGLSDEEAANGLEVQAESWTNFISTKLAEADVKLTPTPNSLEEKLRWIWELAQIHRGGTKARSDVRSLFAKELIQTLNKGFLWGSESGDILRLPPENPPIDLANLPPAYKALLTLDTSNRSDSPNADFLPLVSVIGEDGNKPDHVEIIHCPFSLSACLELQIPKGENPIRLEAHYVIPQDRSLLKGPIQITRHTQAVRLTSRDGTPRKVTGGIVVMLVGASGRIEKGVRTEANPSWLTKRQLLDLSVIIEDICSSIAAGDPDKEAKCMSIPMGRAPEAGEVTVQGGGSTLNWGDMPDFDPMIFSAYFASPGNDLAGGLSLTASSLEVKAGEPVTLNALFTDRVRQIVFERMVRCPDRSIAWTKVSESQIRYTTTFSDQFQLWDAGPNNNGTHFIRAKAYGKEGLLGWDLLKIFTTNFDRDYQDVVEDCRK
jgi:hypothetical protein